MTRAEKMIKQIIGKFKSKPIDCIPPSRLKEIHEAYKKLPEHPAGKVAPQWQKTKKTAGTNGETTS